jgi:GNAT superfamily N-acetyltransferase
MLPQIENMADRRFARVGLQRMADMPEHATAALEQGRRHGLLWIATSPRGHVTGFALMEIKRDIALIEQLSVLDRWQGHGFGTALIERCAATARALGHEPLYLTTYRDVAWNKPFYQRRGFTEVPRGALDRTLRGVLLLEVRHGHPVWRRAVMKR